VSLTLDGFRRVCEVYHSVVRFPVPGLAPCWQGLRIDGRVCHAERSAASGRYQNSTRAETRRRRDQRTTTIVHPLRPCASARDIILVLSTSYVAPLFRILRKKTRFEQVAVRRCETEDIRPLAKGAKIAKVKDVFAPFSLHAWRPVRLRSGRGLAREILGSGRRPVGRIRRTARQRVRACHPPRAAGLPA
jgi:hypothetical protein